MLDFGYKITLYFSHRQIFHQKIVFCRHGQSQVQSRGQQHDKPPEITNSLCLPDY